MNAIKLSVIMPTYNSARTLRQCINSLEHNLRDINRSDVEVLVPDRESSDDTLAILKEYPQYRLLPHDLAGISSAYNLAIQNARGQFGVFLNSDDELGPGFIKKMLNMIEASRNPEKHVVYSSVLFIDIAGASLYYRHPAPYLGIIQKYYSIILHPNAIYPLPLLQKYPFMVLPNNPPVDREQVYELMKECEWSRTREVHYRYRIWASSGTVKLAKSKANHISFADRIIKLLGRAYVQSYETNKLERLIRGRFSGSSYWRNPVQ